MNYKVFWTISAENDLNEIIDYIIANGDLNNAYKIFTKIKERVNLLKVSPEQGRIIPEFDVFKNKKYRELIVKPWRIIYKIEKKEVKVLLVIDGRRNIEDILFERLIKKDGT